MKTPEGTPATTLPGVTSPDRLAALKDELGAPRPRAASLDSSKSWMRSFTRRSSVDISDMNISPAGSIENLSADDQPRSRHGSGDSGSEGTTTRLMSRRKSDSNLWKWGGMFQIGGQNADKIQEMDENESSAIKFEAKPADLNSTIKTGQDGSLGLMKFARKMSARDLNALCPTGDL